MQIAKTSTIPFVSNKEYNSISQNGKSIYFLQSIEVFRDGELMNTCIGNVRSGDLVRSRDESTKKEIWVEVLDIHNHGKLELVWILFENGESVKCTINHKFRVTDGRMLPLWMIIEEDFDIVSE